MLALACALQAGTAHADGDITLQQGKKFSLYASGNCKRIAATQVDLILECDFRGKRAEFYLKEFPRMAAPDIASPSIDVNAQIERLMRLVLAGLDADMGERIRLYGGTGMPPTIFNYYGFRYTSVEHAKSNARDFADKRVLVRTHTIMGALGFETAVLVTISDFDPSQLPRNHGVPDEVMTMFASLDSAPYRTAAP